ncbi:MAG: sigma-70 family RNA polymerase sigma factor [Patescibacteria group bacterium]
MLDGEEKLIARAIEGESSAFGLLYDYYQPKIYRFAVLRTGRREEAEDLTHQVFLHAWQRVGEYQFLGFPFSSWLYRIARNAIIDHYRTRREASSVEDVDLQSHTNLERDTDMLLQMDRVRKAIASMRDEHQEVIIMRFVEELSIKEVADALDKTEGAVKLLQHRAMRELQRTLDVERANNK